MPSQEIPRPQAGLITFEKYLPKPVVTTLEQDAQSRSAAESMARAYGGRLPSISEFISAMGDPQKYMKIGGAWHWLGDEGLKVSGYCKIDYEALRLVEMPSKAEWDKLPLEQKAYVHGGSGPVAFDVCGCQDASRLVAYVGSKPSGPSRLTYINTGKELNERATLKRA
jgi:hypothetical protein